MGLSGEIWRVLLGFSIEHFYGFISSNFFGLCIEIFMGLSDRLFNEFLRTLIGLSNAICIVLLIEIYCYYL